MNHFENKPSEMEVPDIPDIPEDLLPAIVPLVRLAYMFRGVFMQAAEGKSLEDIWEERGEYLLLGDKVLMAWIDSLDLDIDH